MIGTYRRAGFFAAGYLAAVAALVGAAFPVSAREIFVAKSGSDTNKGDSARPFRTIQRAAEMARPGDVITVRAGVYREQIDPARGGTKNKRITYQAAPGEEVKVVGSERVTGWTKAGYFWRVVLPSQFFHGFNPFAASIGFPGAGKEDTDRSWGWLRHGRWTHRGDLYVDGESFTEVETPAALARPKTWWAQVDAQGNTTLTANFSDKDPNAAWTEVNVRPTIFYPSKPGLGYITVRGFIFMNAAPYWAAPLLNQLAAVGPNGGAHWVIENNGILHSRATCLSIGLPSSGQDDANSGHHIVRDNVISHCGQAGIIGLGWHRGSLIANNVIENINKKYEFGGAETGAIKFHRFTDAIIEHNLIRNVGSLDPNHSNGDGIWLDTHSERVTIRNNILVGVDANTFLMEANYEGPIQIENNIAIGGSLATFSSMNGTWKNNLFLDAHGFWVNQTDLDRPPIQGTVWERNIYVHIGADGRRMPAEAGLTDVRRANLYLGGAQAASGEEQPLVVASDPQVHVDFDAPQVTVSFTIDKRTFRSSFGQAGTGRDFFGQARSADNFSFGPFSQVRPGRNVFPIFQYSSRYFAALKALQCGVECPGAEDAPNGPVSSSR